MGGVAALVWFFGVLPTLGVTAAGAGAGSTASSGVTGEELKNCLCVSISIAEVDGAAAGALDAAGDDLPTVRL